MRYLYNIHFDLSYVSANSQLVMGVLLALLVQLKDTMTMSTLYWNGSTGRMNVAANWGNPGGSPKAPRSGDTARITGGTVMVMGEGVGVNVILDGIGSANEPTLNLKDGSIGSIAVNAQQYSFYTSAHGKVEVTGRVTGMGGIKLGAIHAAADTLVMTELPYSTFVNQGAVSVLNGSALLESGGQHSSFENDGVITTSGASTLKFGSTVTGEGTISDSAVATGGGSRIEFGGGVGSGQTINLNAGTLQLDKPMAFHATIAALNASAAPVYGPTSGLGNGAIVLEHTRADSAIFSADELVLKDAGVTVADLHFSGLAKTGTAQLWVGREADGSTAVTGYAVAESHALYVSAMPTLLS